MVDPRTLAGCSRVNSVIYCKDGYIHQEDGNGKPILSNEHISLNLSQIEMNEINNDGGDMYFSKFNPSQLKWEQLSNINHATGKPTEPTAYSATTILTLEKAYVTYGGSKYNSVGGIVPPVTIFMKYNILNDTWYPLPPFSTTHEFFSTSLINIGNDVLWKYGGYIPIKESMVDIGYSLFDNKNLSWSGPILYPALDLQIGYTCGHSLTLVENTIYKIGGSVTYINKTLDIDYQHSASLKDMVTFDTKSMKWSIFTAIGPRPSNRDYHSATYIPDKKLILIYGGATIINQDVVALENDKYVIYNITSNTYMGIEEPRDTPFPKERFGHYATLYNSKYLLLMFGSIRDSKPAGIINVLNITDPLNPIYIPNFNGSNQEEQDANANHRLSTTTLIIIIVISIAVLLAFFIAFIYYIRRKMKEKRANIQLEKEDPRKSITITREHNIIKPNSDDNNGELKIQQLETLALNNHQHVVIDCIKPNQVFLCKAYENQYDEKTLYIDEKEELLNDIRLSSTLNQESMDLKSVSFPSTPSTDTQSSSINICKPSSSEI
ncbi:unnamed protein product [Cunninghamella blakesleeana]